MATLMSELKEVRERFPNWTTDNLFVHWFLQAFLLADGDLAAQSVTGVSHDKGIDGIYLDESLRRVFLVQGKLHQAPKPPSEGRANVLNFANIARKLSAPPSEFASFRTGLDPLVAARLDQVRERVRKRDFEVSLYYVTTGVCSGPLKAEAEAEAAQANAKASMTVLEREDILGLLTDYIGGAAPPVPFLDLRVDARGVTGSDAMIQRYDARTQIESWILTMSGKEIGELYKKAGDRLFARNIRGFLGNTSINEGISNTLAKEPENFWYYNNGVTIICNTARKTSERAEAILRVTNPQIINGQQTTRMLSEVTASKAAVVVRVIAVPRNEARQQSDFEKLVSNIVAATNWQNAILSSDLRANDARQVLLQREFAKLNYHYLRKRQTKKEAKRLLGKHYGFWIKMDELAQLVAACELDPYLVRSGKQGLFEPPMYDQIFDHRSVESYLSIYWLGRLIKATGAGYPDRAYAKWHAMHFLWGEMGSLLRRRRNAKEFRRLSELREVPSSLTRAANLVFVSLIQFYRSQRGKGRTAIDISNFFYRPKQNRLFEEFWNDRANHARKSRLSEYLSRAEADLEAG